ncbi:hypothetical protein CALVIDRAFT_537168 [Calocera viscosa TUFC12733]|uniref:Uncharacterized protein n=1 Tax=Calocera viscosa (strain TUFC12733) TaxID=1330018 RepID=A0A167M6P8_CALVF|nr:hypothetical protein CALVIDRAFT_537168 [Calocera viscosa TUFC12733]
MAPVPSTLAPRALPPGTFYWPVTEDQSNRLSELLNIDFSELGVRGAFIGSPLLICIHCGKLSGMEDFIYEALQRGIHTPEFIIEDLKAGGKGSHSQILHCMDCGEAYMRSGSDEQVAAATKRELDRRAAGGDPAEFKRSLAEAGGEAARAYWDLDWISHGERDITLREAGSDWRKDWVNDDKRELGLREAGSDWRKDWVDDRKRDIVPRQGPTDWTRDWVDGKKRDASAAGEEASAYWDLDWLSGGARDLGSAGELEGREPVPAPSPWFADWVDVDSTPEGEVEGDEVGEPAAAGARSLEELD